MNSQNKRDEIISALLMAPALFLITAGILFMAFRIEGANHLLEVLLSNPIGKLVLSPVVVLGGPLLAGIRSARKVLHLSADIVNEEFVIAVSIKTLYRHLACIGLAIGLIVLLVGYAFVENFQLVPR